MSLSVVDAYISLGSNIHFPQTQVLWAFLALDKLPQTQCIKRSSLYRTKPWGGVVQPDFINAVVQLRTSLEARNLLKELLKLEQCRGRTREQQWGPRTLDCDLLLYGQTQIQEADLIIPHPRIQERAFVLIPLAEVAPDLIFLGKTLTAWALECDNTQIEKLN